MFLKSYASMIVKINYFTRTLNRPLNKEAAFPLLLHYNFTGHIWPRCEVLRDYGVKTYELKDCLGTSDEEFCRIFKVEKK